MPQKFRLKISCASQLFAKYAIHDIIKILSEIGYDAIEIWASQLDQQLKKRETSLAKIKSALVEHKMAGSIHAPTSTVISDEKIMLNVCSKEKELRALSIKKNLEAMDYADEFGFRMVTIHPGHMDSVADKLDDDYWQLQIDAFKQFAQRAEKTNVDIGIELMENRPREFVTEPPALKKIIKAVDSPNMGITFDLTHAFTHGEDKPIEFLDDSGEHIFHAHMSGHSKYKTHVPFNMGIIPASYMDKVLAKLIEHHAGMVAIEGHLTGMEGIMEDTKENEKRFAADNIEYISRELKSLHVVTM